jgi:hypothetical protein
MASTERRKSNHVFPGSEALAFALVLLSVGCSHAPPQPTAPGGVAGSGPSNMAGMVATAAVGATRAGAAALGNAGKSAVGSAGPGGNTTAAGNSGMSGQAAAGSGTNPSAGSMSTAGTTADAGVISSDAGASDAAASDGDLWISPQGSDTNPGTQASPLQTLGAATKLTQPGRTIWVLPGTYTSTQTVVLSADGEEQRPLRIFAADAEAMGMPAARPVFDFSAQPRGQSSARGLELSGTYWHVRGIDVIKAGDNCIHISGAHNTVENVVVHGCDDTGLQITANGSDAADKTRAAYNTVLNCDSYENFDSANQGENADGFAAKLYIGPGNVFRGCRAWNNSDDGWDLFASDDVVVIEDCWAIANGKIGASQNNTNGDGNGFKLGGAPNAGDANQGGAVHEVKNCLSIGNRACGYVLNNNSKTPKLSMCGGQGDGKGMLCSLTNSGTVVVTSSASAAIMAKRKPDGSLPMLP